MASDDDVSADVDAYMDDNMWLPTWIMIWLPTWMVTAYMDGEVDAFIAYNICTAHKISSPPQPISDYNSNP